MVEGKVDARVARATASQIGGTNHRGFALVPGEVAFKLDGKFERLEVFVSYRPEKGLPPYAAVDSRPIVARASECRRIREALWDLVARDFRDRQSQIEMEMERRDGIWNPYLETCSGAPSGYYLARAQERLELARKTLEFVQRTAPRPKMAAELQALDQRVDRAVKDQGLSAERELFAQAVEHYPDFEQGRVGLGRVLIALGQPDVALPHLEKAAALDPEDDVAFFHLWQAHRALGHADQEKTALAEFQRLRNLKREQERRALLRQHVVTQQELEEQMTPP